jgi:Zn-dependent M28 family amino/carboxypeptidase
VIEAARILSKEKFAGTIVYAVLSGEEQGLWGGKLLASTAKARGWKVAAVLNNDIVGNTHGIGGEHVTDVVRVFSEGLQIAGDPKPSAAIGGEDDSPSRALAKAVSRVAASPSRDRAGGVRGAPARSLPARWRSYPVPGGRLSRGALHRGDRELRSPAPVAAHRERP